MTVIPLVVSLLIATIAREKDLGDVGRMGGRDIVIFTVLLSVIALIGVFGGPPLLDRIQFDPAAVASLRASSTTDASKVQLPTFASWVVGLVPANPIKAAADGAMLPLIVFAVVFGLALGRIEEEKRDAVLRFVRAVAETMQQLVVRILDLAPFAMSRIERTKRPSWEA